MRIFFTVIIALLATSCTNNKKSTAQKSESNDTIQSTIEGEISTEIVDTIPTLKDSVYQLTNYKLRVKEIDSLFIAPLYADQKTRDAIFKKSMTIRMKVRKPLNIILKKASQNTLSEKTGRSHWY